MNLLVESEPQVVYNERWKRHFERIQNALQTIGKIRLESE